MRKLILALFSVAFMFTGCSSFKEVQVTGIKGFKINKINTEGIDGDILLTLKNPNNVGFSIYKSEFNVMYSGINLGKALLTKKVKIKANAEETYSFNLKSDFKNVNLLDVMKLLNGASVKNNIQVKGNLNAGKFFIRKSFPVDLKERISLQ